MGDALDKSALRRWRSEPTAFITEIMRDPETGRPFELLAPEQRFLRHGFKSDSAGRLWYPEQVYALKPSSTSAAVFVSAKCASIPIRCRPVRSGFAAPVCRWSNFRNRCQT
jgi:hypothetical protein